MRLSTRSIIPTFFMGVAAGIVVGWGSDKVIKKISQKPSDILDQPEMNSVPITDIAIEKLWQYPKFREMWQGIENKHNLKIEIFACSYEQARINCPFGAQFRFSYREGKNQKPIITNMQIFYYIDVDIASKIYYLAFEMFNLSIANQYIELSRKAHKFTAGDYALLKEMLENETLISTIKFLQGGIKAGYYDQEISGVIEELPKNLKENLQLVRRTGHILEYGMEHFKQS